MSNSTTKDKKTLNLSHLDNSYLTCRATVHTWVEVDPNEWGHLGLREPFFGWLRVTRCLSCDTLRRETINTYGQVGARSYRYPPGYQLVNAPKTDESGRTPKDKFRKEWMKRRGIKRKRYR